MSHPSGIIRSKRKVERRYPRIDLAALSKVFGDRLEYLPVKLMVTDNEQCRGMLVDVSEKGCKVAAPVLLQEGETVKVGFILNGRTIAAHGIVRWANSLSGVNLVGVEFEKMTQDAREYLMAVSAIALLDADEIARMKRVLEGFKKD